MPRRNQIPTRAPALLLLLGMIVGFCIARELSAPLAFSLSIAFALAVLSLVFSLKNSRIWLLAFFVATSLVAWAYGTLRLPAKPEPAALEMPIREAHLHLKVERVMQARNKYGKASGIASVQAANSTSRLNTGAKVFFRIDLPNEENFNLLRGCKVQATGVLTPISSNVAPDSFEAYLKDIGIHYRFERTSELKLLQAPSKFDQFSQRMNEHFQRYLRLGAPTEGNLDNIYIAMLLGQKAQLSKQQTDRFKMTGTMHFFAISGLHIGVIATVIAQFLVLIRVPRKISPFIGLPLLYLYVEITGSSPSAVRAFLMALFFWTSFAFTRQRSAIAALAASAVFVLILKPDQLWSIGFQLSYTVVLSILLFGLPLYEILSERLDPFSFLPKADWTLLQRAYAWTQDLLLLLFSISFSAWLASALLSAAFFGYFSPGAILLNMLLVNLAALAISTGVISLSFAVIGLEVICEFINHAAWVCIHLMDQLVIGSTKIPGIIIHCDDFATWIAYCGLISYFALLFWLHRARNYRSKLMWTLPPTVILAALLCGLNQI